PSNPNDPNAPINIGSYGYQPPQSGSFYFNVSWGTQVPDKIRLTDEEVEDVRSRVLTEIGFNQTCAEFLEKLARITLGADVSAADLLNEGINRAHSTLGIYWAAYPGAGGVATTHKIGSTHANKGEIWYSSKKDAMYPMNVAGLIHEIFHVAA